MNAIFDATPLDPSATGVPTWLKELFGPTWVLFSGVDFVVCLFIGIVTYNLFYKNQRVSDRAEWIFAMCLGAIWGAWQSWEQNSYAYGSFMMKGALANGVGSSVAARVAGPIVAKVTATVFRVLGVTDSPSPPPPDPPARDPLDRNPQQ